MAKKTQSNKENTNKLKVENTEQFNKENKIKLKVKGMTCAHCELTIEEGLKELPSVKDVQASFSKGTVIVVYEDKEPSKDDLEETLKDLGYSLENNEENSRELKEKRGEVLYVLIIILGGYMILKELGLLNFTDYFPQVESSMGYGFLFVIGLLTSLHCIAMCGGINLAQSINSIEKSTSSLKPNALYNLGRVISYTIIGGLAGALGSVVTVGGTFRGTVAILAGVFMVIMGINMTGIFPGLRRFNLKMPKFIGRRINGAKRKSTSSFYIGLLNGLMPCGPLQSMQLYALSTGSFAAGALSMFLFSLGTVPLMFGLGALTSKLSKKFTEKIITIGAVLVVVLGIGMLNNGLALSGIVVSKTSSDVEAMNTARVEGDYQSVNTSLEFRSYPVIKVKAGIPVKWTITAEAGKLTGCNNEIIIPKLGVTKELKEGENVIEFTPSEPGQYGYSCWMGMIRSTIIVE